MRSWLLIFLAAALHAQSSASALVEEARSQPIEIFADIAFRLLPHLSPAARIDTLTEIFERAGEARNSFPSSYPDVPALDALSIRSRAIRTMLTLDGKRGRRLFESMARPNVPRPGCEETAVPNAGIYMDTVEAVFRQAHFTESEREKGVPWSLVIDAVRGAGSAAEIAAAQRLLPLASTEREQAEITSALASGLAVQDSDRAFTSVPPARLVGSIVNVGSFQRRTNQFPLLFALRDYLMRHLTASRCEVTSPANPDGVEDFNQAISGRSDIRPLTADETKAAKREGRPETPHVDPAYLALERRLNALSRRQPGQEGAKFRESPEWRDKALQLLSDIESWEGASRAKLKLLKPMVVAAPDGVLRQTALSGTINILGDPAFLLQAPDTWVLELRDLLMLAGAMTALRAAITRMGTPPTDTGLEIPNQFAASRLPALSLYGRLLLLGLPPKAR